MQISKKSCTFAPNLRYCPADELAHRSQDVTMMKKILLLLPLVLLVSCGKQSNSDGFSWDKATVYFLLTDRFYNGDTTNDNSYGRATDYGSERLNASTFHGGDWAGLYQKIQDGYFTDLGVDVVWLTDPYEQIHGWTTGSGIVNDFPHYGYHGYYPLDYTQTDANYGTVEELHKVIDALHAQGIRVMMGANINDVGYPTFSDYNAFYSNGNTIDEQWRPDRGQEYFDTLTNAYNWSRWFTDEWLRRPLSEDELAALPDPRLATTIYGLPDVLTEKEAPVSLPLFWKDKWQQAIGDKRQEKYTWSKMVTLRKDAQLAPTEYVIRWIAAWVEEFGIDGYRCDVVEYVHPERWQQLYETTNAALQCWRKNHPQDPASQWKDDIYFTGDHEDAYITRLPEYEAVDFKSMVNMMFPKDGNLSTIIPVWQAYADSMNQWREQGHEWYPFSYLNNAYFRDADMAHMDRCAITFLLAPGAVQIFYGDETNRPMSDARYNVDAAQAFRSDMNWQQATGKRLWDIYSQLCHLRKAHPAIGAGQQTIIDNHTVLRTLANDTVCIHLDDNQVTIGYNNNQKAESLVIDLCD